MDAERKSTISNPMASSTGSNDGSHDSYGSDDGSEDSYDYAVTEEDILAEREMMYMWAKHHHCSLCGRTPCKSMDIRDLVNKIIIKENRLYRVMCDMNHMKHLHARNKLETVPKCVWGKSGCIPKCVLDQFDDAWGKYEDMRLAGKFDNAEHLV